MLRTLLLSLLLVNLLTVAQEKPTRLGNEAAYVSPLTRAYIYPTRIIWSAGNLVAAENLLKKGDGQANLTNQAVTRFNNGDSAVKASVLLDFGREINASLEIITGMWSAGNTPRNVRIRLGESVSEAMSEIGEQGATNDHAMRDFTMKLPWLGKNQTGESGFRFVRLDFLDSDSELQLREIRAVSTFRDIPYLGSFKSSDERLNKIWEVGAYTVHLNMQDYLWDGIKRDRLVWVGDLHPEVASINTVFGYNDVVPKSLDLARDATPLPGWMCGISTYSMWWIVLQHDWYMQHGDLDYLETQGTYLGGLVRQMVSKVVDGRELMDGTRFLDWPSSEDTVAIHAGIQAMTVLSLEKAGLLSRLIGDSETEALCVSTVKSMKSQVPAYQHSKQATAMLSLAEMINADEAATVVGRDGTKNFSTFYGYYMLEALARAGKHEEAMHIISEYWGAMLDLGATTFWEDFNMDWLPNAARIDEIVPSGKVDLHAQYGDYCYVGFRHSFCHGWASGPTAWLSAHVLGIKPLKPGGKVFSIAPNLGHLTFVEGTYPTVPGVIHIKHTKGADGKVKSKIRAPKGIKIVRI